MNEQDMNSIESAMSELEKAMDEDVLPRFGIFRSRHPEVGEEDVYVLANEEGIVAFTYELLSSLNPEYRDENNLFSFSPDDFDGKGDCFIQYVKVLTDDPEPTERVYEDTRWKARFFLGFILALFLFIVVCFFWGLFSIIGAIFG